MWREVYALIKKDVLLEFRQRYSFFSVILYVFSTVYIAYLVFISIKEPRIWNALFWVIIVFAAINTASRSFANESGNRFWYYHQLASARAMIVSKVLYNTAYIWAVSLITLGVYSWFVGNPVKDIWQYILVLLLGSAGFSSILTVVAAIAARTSNNATLMAILSIPLLLPVVIIIAKASLVAMFGLPIAENTTFLGALVALNTLVLALGYLLFTYLWRE